MLRLGSLDQAEVNWAWRQINKTVLQHQGTVYPATVAAAPFLCQLALDAMTPWCDALTVDLAFLSLGVDEPFAPAGRRVPGGPWLLGLDQGPDVYSPVLGAMQLAARLRAREAPGCDAFSCVFSLLLNLMEYGGKLIDQPR